MTMRRYSLVSYATTFSGLFFVVLILLVPESWAQVGAKIDVDKDRWISIGGGLRTSFESVEDGSPNKKTDPALLTLKVFVFTSIHKFIREYSLSLIHKGIPAIMFAFLMR